MLVFAVLNLI